VQPLSVKLLMFRQLQNDFPLKQFVPRSDTQWRIEMEEGNTSCQNVNNLSNKGLLTMWWIYVTYKQVTHSTGKLLTLPSSRSTWHY